MHLLTRCTSEAEKEEILLKLLTIQFGARSMDGWMDRLDRWSKREELFP